MDRVEEAYTENDIGELESLIEVGDFRDAVEAKKQTMMEELGAAEGPTSVSEPIVDAVVAVLICDSRYNRRIHRCASDRFVCERQAHRANRVRSQGKERREIQQLKSDKALQRCENIELRCMLRAAEKRSTCYWLASLIPIWIWTG